MDRLFVFAIGGTGARVLRSFTMLLASGQESMKEYDVYPIILDYDENNGDTNIATQCIEHYKTIHDMAWKDEKMSKEKGYFKSNLCQLKADDRFGGSSFRMVYAPKGYEVYKDYIGYNTLGKDEANGVNTSLTQMLLDSLYNTDPASDDSEINLNMEVGFKGNPNIGSVVFHDLDSECTEFRQFLLHLNRNDKVVVVGSLFGGTGASGIPEIIRKIRAKAPTVQIGAVLVMPYFAPEPKPGGTIRYEIFNSKTKAAINYYEDSGMIKFDPAGNMTGGMINSVYFIGDPKPTILRYCDGGEQQLNPANIVEFISALSILNFVEGGRGSFKYGVNEYIIGENIAVKQLFYDDLFDTSNFTQPIIQRLTSFTVALKYSMFRMLQPDQSLKKTTYYSCFTLEKPRKDMLTMLNGIKSFWAEYQKWLDELSNKDELPDKGNSHSLNLFSTEKNLEILIEKPSDQSNNKKGGIFGGGRRPGNKSVKGSTIDGLINQSVTNFKPTGWPSDFVTNDEEFLLMHGLFEASTNEKEIVRNLFS